MVFLTSFLCSVLFLSWSFLFLKTYQLSSYNVPKFLQKVIKFELSFGDKTSLVFTKRLVRFLIVLMIVSYGLFFLINYFVSSFLLIIFDYLIMLIFSPAILVICHYIILPIENLIKLYYIFIAKRKLSKKDIIKIGITGSYGKTSTKNILTTMLEKEYKVCVTPKSYNTEMGITKTILSSLDDHDVFIAEMGARHKGDIEKLAKIVSPQYGIITTIGEQHLETFLSLAVIEQTKFELAQNIAPPGIMVFNGDSQSTRNLFYKFNGKKYLTCQQNGFAFSQNEKITSEGSEFDLIIDGKVFKVKTKLIGKCNIDNIVSASALAYLLDINPNDIISAIKSLLPIPHRLELIKNDYMTIIDDSYNSNTMGFKEALKVLSKFEGKKIVVTPGIVEMGKSQSNENFVLGGLIADVADFIIIMNDTNKNELLSGAISHEFNREKIFFANTRKKQKEILSLLTSKDCVVLFENDLPDDYK